MPFDWDEAKNSANMLKHGIRFEEACLIFHGHVLTSIDGRFDYGEIRYVSIGQIRGVVTVVLVHTDRDGIIRIISARLANRREKRKYHDSFPGAPPATGLTQ